MDFMGRALQLAERALGISSPNPAVGAVLVKDGRIVGEGWTQPPGQAHAEIMALRQAGNAARSATLYVTLEPCCHHGKTPPCTEAILAAGIKRVVVASDDPSEKASGRGLGILRDEGVEVITVDGEVSRSAGECRARIGWTSRRRSPHPRPTSSPASPPVRTSRPFAWKGCGS